MNVEMMKKETGLKPETRRMLEEIAYMESRLAEIGHDGDCAYEKAIVKFFEAKLAERKVQLGVA